MKGTQENVVLAVRKGAGMVIIDLSDVDVGLMLFIHAIAEKIMLVPAQQRLDTGEGVCHPPDLLGKEVGSEIAFPAANSLARVEIARKAGFQDFPGDQDRTDLQHEEPSLVE